MAKSVAVVVRAGEFVRCGEDFKPEAVGNSYGELAACSGWQHLPALTQKVLSRAGVVMSAAVCPPGEVLQRGRRVRESLSSELSALKHAECLGHIIFCSKTLGDLCKAYSLQKASQWGSGLRFVGAENQWIGRPLFRSATTLINDSN